MNKRIYTLLSHFTTWVVLFLLPMTIRQLEFPAMLVPTIGVIAVFYINYSWLTSHFYMKGRKALCWVVNAVIVAAIAIAMHFWLGLGWGYFFNMAVATMIATATRMASYWQQAEEKRLKAEMARADAELRNLRYQTSPHLLLNTLNDIYALITFDTQRAQEAIRQLSAILRHILYDNNEQEVSIESEAAFLSNYTELMKIRVPDNIDITFDTTMEAPNVKVVPLVLIPLVENAFKHGVSTSKPSFIHIVLKADSRQIDFQIENSNHRKDNTDRSGHGIGLEQVRRRLEFAYHGHYTWKYGVSEDGMLYRSHITIAIT